MEQPPRYGLLDVVLYCLSMYLTVVTTTIPAGKAVCVRMCIEITFVSSY